jgi:uncharacterized membrane protein
MKTRHIILLGVLSFPLVAGTFLGITGIQTLYALILLFVVPAYLLLDLTSLRTEEKLFIGIPLGASLFPLAAFYLNRVIPSLRVSSVVVFVLSLLIWYAGKRLRRVKAGKATQQEKSERRTAQHST